MKLRSRILSTSVARGMTILCAAVFLTSAHTAQAGINVWTSNGPEGGHSSRIGCGASSLPTYRRVV
jgi:hypothetical protein